MTEQEYLQWEKEAIERGYKKYNTTSSSNDYSYFKTIGKKDGKYLYMIEWRVWDWRKYIDRDPTVKDRPFSLEVNIIPDSGKYDMRLDMLIGEPLVFGFDRIEEIAERYYQFVKKMKCLRYASNKDNTISRNRRRRGMAVVLPSVHG